MRRTRPKRREYATFLHDGFRKGDRLNYGGAVPLGFVRICYDIDRYVAHGDRPARAVRLGRSRTTVSSCSCAAMSYAALQVGADPEEGFAHVLPVTGGAVRHSPKPADTGSPQSSSMPKANRVR